MPRAVSTDPVFYRFVRTLQAYGGLLDEKTTLILPSDSELLRLLEEGDGTRGGGP